MRKLLQVSFGLKRKALQLADKYEDVFIDGESRFGACDLPIMEAKAIGAEKIIHVGHSKFMDSEIPVEYIELREKYDPTKVLEKDFNKIKDFKSIGLLSTIQFIDSLKTAKNFLEKRGIKGLIGKGGKRNYDGQILGCDISPALDIGEKVDAFLFIGSGKFHPLGVALKYKKPLFVLDVEKNEIVDIEDIKQKFLKQKYTAIGLAKHAKTFGILISVKPGQINVKLAERLKRFLEEKGKKAYILVFNEIKPEKLEEFDLDCYVNTACPRIPIEDRGMYKKPIVSYEELMESFK